ncbi:MAG: rod shape-determining protein MreD [Acidobacteria bacterium]|nr:rod shape-determining protein MreD [Acidobacteriota bacterium]
MKYLFLAISSILMIAAQMVAGSNFFLFNFLDFSLLLIAYWALYRNRIQALFVGSLTGVLLDAVIGWPLGYNGFGKTLAAYVIGQTAKHFNVEEGWIRFVLLAGSSCVSSFSIFLLFALLQRGASPVFLGASLAQALITGLVGVLLFAAHDSYQHAHSGKAS